MNNTQFLTKYYKDYKKHEDEKFTYVTYPGISPYRYVISNYGQVIDFKKNKLIKYFIDKDGYFKVRLKRIQRKDDIKLNQANVFIHRLVAYEYVANKNPEKFIVVNHLDCNNQNNYYKNLEWTDVRGNTLHAIKHGLTIRTGIGSNGQKYSEEILRDVCSKLEQGMSINKVFKTYYPNESTDGKHHAFYQYIYRLKYDKKYMAPVRNQYNISIKKIYDYNRVSNKDLEKMTKMIKDGKTNDEIYKAFGIKLGVWSDRKKKMSDRLYTLRKLIKKREQVGIK